MSIEKTSQVKEGWDDDLSYGEWDLRGIGVFVCLLGVFFLDKKWVWVSLRQMDLECFVVSCLFIPALVYKVSNVHLKPYNFVLVQRKQIHGDNS